MLDSDLAELYQVPTKRLNEQVKRNINRFPEDFMFQLSQEEWIALRSQIATSNTKGGRRTSPYIFTEHGVLMLSSVLSSDRAIQVNIQIMRIYSKLRKLLLTNKKILLKLEKVEKKLIEHDDDLKVVFQHLGQLVQKGNEPRKRIGYRK